MELVGGEGDVGACVEHQLYGLNNVETRYVQATVNVWSITWGEVALYHRISAEPSASMYSSATSDLVRPRSRIAAMTA